MELLGIILIILGGIGALFIMIGRFLFIKTIIEIYFDDEVVVETGLIPRYHRRKKDILQKRIVELLLEDALENNRRPKKVLFALGRKVYQIGE